MVQYTSPRLNILKIKTGPVQQPKKINGEIKYWFAIGNQEKKQIKNIIWIVEQPKKKRTRIRKLGQYSSPRICIDWDTRIAQCNEIGLIDEPKNRKSMVQYTSPRIRLIRVKIGLLEETKNKIGMIEQTKNIDNI